MQALHDLDIQRLERVAGRLDEEDASMDAVVDDVHAVNLVLGIEVSVEALLNVVDNRPPRFVVVDKVTKARRVDDGEPQTHTRLLNIRADRLDGNGLGDDVKAGLLALLWGVERSVEQGVDKGRLSEARFTYGRV